MKACNERWYAFVVLLRTGVSCGYWLLVVWLELTCVLCNLFSLVSFNRLIFVRYAEVGF